MAEYIERTERLVLALNAGARAIENNKRLVGTTYVVDVFSENPKEISYCEAAKLLREVSETTHTDVAPVRHARLTETGLDEAWCSWGDCTACGGSNMMGAIYCNWCGAKLDGGADNGE